MGARAKARVKVRARVRRLGAAHLVKLSLSISLRLRARVRARIRRLGAAHPLHGLVEDRRVPPR